MSERMRAGAAVLGLCGALAASPLARADLSLPPSIPGVIYGTGAPPTRSGALGQIYVDAVGHKVWQRSSATTWHQVGIFASPTDADITGGGLPVGVLIDDATGLPIIDDATGLYVVNG